MVKATTSRSPRTVQYNFTLAAWIKTDTPGVKLGDQGYEGSGLIWSDVPGMANDFILAVLGTKLSFFCGNPDLSANSDADVVTGDWVHVAAIRSAHQQTSSIYINGKHEKSLAHANSGPLDANPTIAVGGNIDDSRYYTGVVDDVRLYNRALSEGEILDVMNWGVSPSGGGQCRFYRVGCMEGEAPQNLAITSDQAGAIFLEFDTVGERTYIVQSTERLFPSPAWSTVSSIKGDGGRLTFATALPWVRMLGGSRDDAAYSVERTGDGGYIVAGFTQSFGAWQGDMWLVKMDPNGAEVWSRTFGGTDTDGAFCVQQTTDGGYIVAGYTASFGAGGQDVYLLKTDSNGNEVWSRTFGGVYDDVASSVQQTADGGYIVAGYSGSFGAGEDDIYLVRTDMDGNPLWSRTFGGSGYDSANSVRQTSDGGYIVAGATQSFGAGGQDVYLLKTDANGNEVWSKTFGGSDGDGASSVQQSSDGGYIVAGTTLSFGAGERDMYLVKTDPSGAEVWSRTFGGSGYDHAYSVQQTTDGGYIVAGSTYSFGAGQEDVYLIKTDWYGYAPSVEDSMVESAKARIAELVEGTLTGFCEVESLASVIVRSAVDTAAEAIRNCVQFDAQEEVIRLTAPQQLRDVLEATSPAASGFGYELFEESLDVAQPLIDQGLMRAEDLEDIIFGAVEDFTPGPVSDVLREVRNVLVHYADDLMSDEQKSARAAVIGFLAHALDYPFELAKNDIVDELNWEVYGPADLINAPEGRDPIVYLIDDIIVTEMFDFLTTGEAEIPFPERLVKPNVGPEGFSEDRVALACEVEVSIDAWEPVVRVGRYFVAGQLEDGRAFFDVYLLIGFGQSTFVWQPAQEAALVDFDVRISLPASSRDRSFVGGFGTILTYLDLGITWGLDRVSSVDVSLTHVGGGYSISIPYFRSNEKK